MVPQGFAVVFDQFRAQQGRKVSVISQGQYLALQSNIGDDGVPTAIDRYGFGQTGQAIFVSMSLDCHQPGLINELKKTSSR
jgi:hypothetical protein